MKRAFGNTLYMLRKKAQLTQAELAKKSGLSQSEISRLEGGYRYPVLKTIHAICKALNTDLAQLLRITCDEYEKPEAEKWRSLSDDNDMEVD